MELGHLKAESVCEKKKTLKVKDVNLDKLLRRRCGLKNKGGVNGLETDEASLFTAPACPQMRQDSSKLDETVVPRDSEAMTTALRRRDKMR